MTIYWHTINKELVTLYEYQSGVGEEVVVESKYSMLRYFTFPKYLVYIRGTTIDKLKVLYGFS